MLYDEFKYGHKSFRSIDGVRHLVAIRPTIRPEPGETEYLFQLRMDRLAAIVARYPEVSKVGDTIFKYDDDRIVECVLDITLVPEPQPIVDTGTVTSRRAEPRGSRGSGRMRDVVRA